MPFRALQLTVQHPLNTGRRARALAHYLWSAGIASLAPRRTISVPLGRSNLEGPARHSVIRLASYVPGGEYDHSAFSFLRSVLTSRSIFLDVGANIGSYSLIAAEVLGKSGFIVAFEPNPEEARFLRVNLSQAACRTEIREVALANRPGELHLVGNESIGHLEQSGAGLPVPVSTLDNEIAHLGITDGELSGAVLKVDVEGWEAAVLAGAQGLLEQRPRAVLFEANGLHTRCPVDLQPVIRDIAERGYVICWPAMEDQVLHVFRGDAEPVSPFHDYVALREDLVDETCLSLGLEPRTYEEPISSP